MKQVRLDEIIDDLQKHLKWNNIWEDEYIELQAEQFETFIGSVCTDEGTDYVLQYLYEFSVSQKPTLDDIIDLYNYLKNNDLLCK